LTSLKTRVVPNIEKMMKEQKKVDMNEIFQGVAIDLIIQAGFATDPQETAELRDLFTIVREAFADPFYTIPFYDRLTFIPSVKKTMDALKRINELALYLIQKRRKHLQEQTRKLNASVENLSQQPIKYIIDLLLEAHDDETNTQLNDTELKDNVLLFFLAGSETSALSMLWFVHNMLVYNPKVYERLQEEVDRVIPSDPNDMTLQDIANLSYLNNVLHESMRVTPSVPISGMRVFKEDTQVGKWLFKKGAEVTINIILTHRNPLNYQSPELFNPDRWDSSSQNDTAQSSTSEPSGEESTKTSAESKDLVQAYSQAGKYAPFGCGRRVCLGKSFAYLEMRVILSYLLKYYKFSLPLDETFPKQKRIRLPTVFPVGGVNLVLEPR